MAKEQAKDKQVHSVMIIFPGNFVEMIQFFNYKKIDGELIDSGVGTHIPILDIPDDRITRSEGRDPFPSYPS